LIQQSLTYAKLVVVMRSSTPPTSNLIVNTTMYGQPLSIDGL